MTLEDVLKAIGEISKGAHLFFRARDERLQWQWCSVESVAIRYDHDGVRSLCLYQHEMPNRIENDESQLHAKVQDWLHNVLGGKSPTMDSDEFWGNYIEWSVVCEALTPEGAPLPDDRFSALYQAGEDLQKLKAENQSLRKKAEQAAEEARNLRERYLNSAVEGELKDSQAIISKLQARIDELQALTEESPEKDLANLKKEMAECDESDAEALRVAISDKLATGGKPITAGNLARALRVKKDLILRVTDHEWFAKSGDLISIAVAGQ